MVCNHVASVGESEAITDDRHQTEATKLPATSHHKTVVVTWGGAIRDNNLKPVSSPTPLNTPPPYYTTELLHWFHRMFHPNTS